MTKTAGPKTPCKRARARSCLDHVATCRSLIASMLQQRLKGPRSRLAARQTATPLIAPATQHRLSSGYDVQTGSNCVGTQREPQDLALL
jgi:hypothetical protein